MTPKISIVIPIYNEEMYIEKCLKSVINQSLKEMEIICINDGSTDCSVDIIDYYMANDSRIRLVNQARTSAGAARNRGIALAKGKYIHFLDADDWVVEGAYSKLYQRMERNDADACVFQYFDYDNFTHIAKKNCCLLNGPERITSLKEEPAFFIYNSVVPWNKLYKLDWIKSKHITFDEIMCANDRSFYFRFLASEAKIDICAEFLMYYRINNIQSLTGGEREKNFKCLFSAFETSKRAFASEPIEHQKMLVDTVFTNFFESYNHVSNNNKPQVFELLHQYFSEIEFENITSLSIPCAWRKEFFWMKTHSSFCEFRQSCFSKPIKLYSKILVWGFRGFLIKIFSMFFEKKKIIE